MDEMLDHALTGHYPNGIIATYITWELSRTHEWRQKLHKELTEFSSTRNDSEEAFPFADIDRLPVLDAIVMESLRLYSSNPGPWPRKVQLL